MSLYTAQLETTDGDLYHAVHGSKTCARWPAGSDQEMGEASAHEDLGTLLTRLSAEAARVAEPFVTLEVCACATRRARR